MNALLVKIGKLFFLRARAPFFYCLLLIPLIIAISSLFMEYDHVSLLEENFINTCKKAKSALEKKEKKQQFLAKYSEANPYFLDEFIESMPLLSNEKQEIESTLTHPALADKQSLESRLHFITKDNRLSFTEEAIREHTRIKETIEKQRHPIQIDEDDLKNLLCRIENIPIGSFSPLKNSPQLIITEFHLIKKETPLKKDVLEIEMELIKREFLDHQKLAQKK